jgi:hypothetical protein
MTTFQTVALAYFACGLPISIYRHIRYVRTAKRLGAPHWRNDPLDLSITVLLFPVMWTLWFPMETLVIVAALRDRP